MNKKKIFIVLGIIFVIWLMMGIVDYSKVHSFERPIFSIIIEPGYEDGGSGRYVGLGYYFDIKGNFMPEDEFPGVTRYDFYIFGIHVESAIRD